MGFRRIAARSAIAFSVVIGMSGAAGAAHAREQGPGEVLQAGVQKMQAEHHVPGVIGMVRDGDATAFAHAGFGDRYARTPADPQAQYRIGSNTKQFVSTVLLQLEAEHKLSLDDTVDRWLPGAVNRNGNDGTKITIRSLLNHSSRLHDYTEDLVSRNEYRADLTPGRAYDPQRLVNIATNQAPLPEPRYSNTNYVLAGMIIKAVTGNDAATEVRTRLIEPLGLTHTTFPVNDSKLYGNWLHGYDNLRDISFSNVQYFGAAGAMVSTLEDLANFDRALFSGRLLPPEQQRELVTLGDFTDYALGVGKVETPCGTGYTHSGQVLGYTNTFISSPDGRRQVVVAGNEFHMEETAAGTAEWDAAVAAYCATGQ